MAQKSGGKQHAPKRATTEDGAPSSTREGSTRQTEPLTHFVLPYSLGSIGVELARVRQARRLSQEELASQAGTSRSTVSLLEQGRRIPSDDILSRILVTLELANSPYAQLTEPAEHPRLRFEQSIGEIQPRLPVGRGGARDEPRIRGVEEVEEGDRS